jgi:hypothetical protein
MKTNQELMAELLQVFQEYQKNLTTLLEHPELLEHHLSVGKKEEGFKSEVVGDMNASPHDGSLTEPQDDFLEVHASIHVEDVCNEVDKTTTFNTPLELSYEVDNTSAYDGHVDNTYDEVFQSDNDDDSTSYPRYDDYDDSGVLAPNHDKDLVLDKFPLDVDLISWELCMKDDKEEA